MRGDYDGGPLVDDHDVADRAKRCYAVSAEILAAMQYRLAELAGRCHVDSEESMLLQGGLVAVSEEIYHGTLVAGVSGDPVDTAEDSEGNTYSDGRRIIHKVRVVEEEGADDSWKFNRFLLDEGAVLEFPLDTVSGIDTRLAGGASGRAEDHNDDLKRRLQTPFSGWDVV
jgi:hypothetical protein